MLVRAGCAVVAVFPPALFLPSFAGAGPSRFRLFGKDRALRGRSSSAGTLLAVPPRLSPERKAIA